MKKRIIETGLIIGIVLCIFVTYELQKKNNIRDDNQNIEQDEQFQVQENIGSYDKQKRISKELYLSYQIVEQNEMLECCVYGLSSKERENREILTAHVSVKVTACNVTKSLDENIYEKQTSGLLDAGVYQMNGNTITNDYSFLHIEYNINNMSEHILYNGANMVRALAAEEVGGNEITYIKRDDIDFNGMISCFYQTNNDGEQKKRSDYFQYNVGENKISAWFVVPDEILSSDKIYLLVGMSGYEPYNNTNGLIHLNTN